MPNEPSPPVIGGQGLRDALLGHLLAAGCPCWPGSDGLTVEDVLRCYADHVAAGRVPDLIRLLQRHPDLEGALRAFFASRLTAGAAAPSP